MKTVSGEHAYQVINNTVATKKHIAAAVAAAAAADHAVSHDPTGVVVAYKKHCCGCLPHCITQGP